MNGKAQQAIKSALTALERGDIKASVLIAIYDGPNGERVVHPLMVTGTDPTNLKLIYNAMTEGLDQLETAIGEKANMNPTQLVYHQLIVTADRRVNARDEPPETLQALQDDIAEHGIRTPILVCHHIMHHLFEVMAGFRRVECVRRLNEGMMIPRIRHIPAQVLTPEEWARRGEARYHPRCDGTVECTYHRTGGPDAIRCGSDEFIGVGARCNDCGERNIDGQQSHMPDCPRAQRP